MKYLVVKDPEDVYGGGIKPVEIHDDEKSAEIAVKLYTEQEINTHSHHTIRLTMRINALTSSIRRQRLKTDVIKLTTNIKVVGLH